MIVRGLICVCAALLASALPARAAGEDERPRPCTAAAAVPVTIQQIMADREAWHLRCVRLTAMSDGLLLYTGVEGYYRSSSHRPSDGSHDRWIGLDNSRLLPRIPGDRFSEVTIVGRVQECETMRAIADQALGPGEIGWVSGYCHTATGPVIWLTAVSRVRALEAVRHTGDWAREAYGDLDFAPENWPHRRLVEARAEAFLRALRSGDRSAFAELHGGGRNRRNSEAAVQLAFAPGSPFAETARNGAPQMAIFVGRHDAADRSHEREDFSAARICFCRTSECAGLWPISRSDADNRPERPYVCTALTANVTTGGSHQIFWTDRELRGLSEPASSTFRR